MPSSQGVSPSPLDIRSSGESSHHRQDSFGSYYSDKDKVGMAQPLLSVHRSNHRQDIPRSGRFDDYRKALSSHPSPSRKSSSSSSGSSSSKPHSPTVNVHTHCGRHSDQYLFGGWSNVVKSALRKD
ncbi:hypothetical protein F4677DRAFT_75578 [Hypoxylon crocopeplum]|nr:hypothetical protein F4677DRAFT_75578 [Hypoxylon crocopeplum]